MNASDFDALVEKALKRIPSRFRRRMQNVAIVVEPEPSPRHLSAGRVPQGHTLLGLYEGRPLPMRSVYDAFTFPDRITIFQGPIERMARGEEHLVRTIEDTVWHEIAHYFGMDERRVRAAERRRSLERVRSPRRASDA